MLEENKFSYRALLHGKDAEWYFARGLDDITAAGSYEVRLFHDDMESLGITTADCDKEHYVVAHLFVSESAATGKQQALRVVGQTLLLTICATNAVKAFTRTCEITPKGASWGSWVDLGAASTTDIQDGSITPQKLSSDIRTSVENPLRPLFVAAGAEYNDTNVDKTRIAPWGETVTHKAGHYYLNGLGDITEEQMEVIFVQTYPLYIATDFTKAFRTQIDTDIAARTNLRNRNQFTGIGSNGVLALESVCYGNSIIEVLMINHTKTAVKIVVLGLENSFYNTSSLRYIVGVLSLEKCSTIELKNCRALVGFNFYNLKSNIKMSQSAIVSKESIVYLIENASPISAVTITLHPDAYSRLADDADVVAALEAQPLISLVSA